MSYMLEMPSLALQLMQQWEAYIALSTFVRVVPQAALHIMAAFPGGIVDNWVETQALDGHAGLPGRTHLTPNIAQPGRPLLSDSTRLRDEDGSPVALVDSAKHLPQRAV